MGAARKRARGRGHGGWWLLALLIAAVAVWTYTERRSAWDGAVAAVQARLHPAPPAVARSLAPPVPASACGPPLPTPPGGALAASRSATFATVEQLLQLPPAAGIRVYRLQARLLRYGLEPNRQYHLVLASLVNPALTLSATIPVGGCASSQDEGALFDELREDIDLRFGPARPQATTLPHPAAVMVTGVAIAGAQGIELRPVLDFRVQP